MLPPGQTDEAGEKAAGGPIGETTSGGLSPSLEAGIGMAYVPAALAKPGEGARAIDIRGKHYAAVIEKKPLYKRRDDRFKPASESHLSPPARFRRSLRPPMNVPDDLRFAPTHEWYRPADGCVGISDHAQAELTDIVYVDLPKVGTKLTAGQTAAVVESVKAASDIYRPSAARWSRSTPCWQAIRPW